MMSRAVQKGTKIRSESRVCRGSRSSASSAILVMLRRSRSGAEACNRLDLHEDFRRGEASDLDERGARKITSEKLLARAPHFRVLFDVDDIDGQFHDVRHRSTGRLDEMSNFAEDDFRLLVLVAPVDRYTVRRAGDRAGDKQQVADAQGVGPPSRRRFGDMGAGNPFDIHYRFLSVSLDLADQADCNHPFSQPKLFDEAALCQLDFDLRVRLDSRPELG